MRTLLLLRGAPGCGKSTWIKEHNLNAYTICPDDLRILCSSRELKADGTIAIAHNREVEQQTWKTLFDLLEFRMSRGEFTVIDATASKTKDIQRYKDLADQYRYKVYCVDFTDIPLETCLRQNKQRPEFKWVPEEAIKNIYARFETQAVPGSVTVIKPNELNKVLYNTFDMSDYEKIVFIGDIHGCYDTLMQYFNKGIDPKVAYIFLGDYIDRGNQNAEVLNWLFSIMNKPNVCLLEGNHERHLKDYGYDIIAKSKVFEEKTKTQLIAGGFTQKMARMFYRKLRQMSRFTYNGYEILACHGGIPTLSDTLSFIPTKDFIRGVGGYNDYQLIASTWMKTTNENSYLIHGHRNTEKAETRIADRVFNLEGGVEFGGQLRIVELTKDLTWNIINIDDCQPVTEDLFTEKRPIENIEQAVSYLRNNSFVQEKKLDDNISSFNFTREAFYRKNWNEQTILARGFFIDTINNKIMARSYEKFFKINETKDTELLTLKNSLKFPVKAWLKENGFLGIVSYNYNNDTLFITTKSTNKGDYVEYFKVLLEPYEEKVLTYLRKQYEQNQAVSLVFEVIDIENDPHIIKYEKSKIILLDIIENILAFKTFSEEDLIKVSNEIGCPMKTKVCVLTTWEDFEAFYNEVQDINYTYLNSYIEGYVFEDANGFMTKCKTGYYNQWKKLRTVCDQTLRHGYITKTGGLLTPTDNYFYGYCKKLYNTERNDELKNYPFKTDIITIRDKFLQYLKNY